MRFDIITQNDLNQTKIPGSSFHFSSVKMNALGSSEYTLVTIVMDTSGSISNFQNDLITMISSIVDACKKSPRAENLLLRVLTFNDGVTEVHGFIPLSNIQAYDQKDLACRGCTALFDATYSAVLATAIYGEDLVDKDYDVNGIIFICTDGDDNQSSFTPSKIAAEIGKLTKAEKIESLTTILIGMDNNSQGALAAFRTDAGLTQFINMGDITPQKLAKLGGFVSKSISSSSQSLGTGSAAPVPSLTF